MTETRKEGFQQQAEQNIEGAALQVARSIQAPGQTKEQTKLIAQGIAKGISLYKKQQSEKARERERARKRMLKQRARTAGSEHESMFEVRGEAEPASIRAALWIAGTLCGVASVFHLWRFLTGLPIVLGTWPVPVFLSLPIAVLSGGLSVWLLLAGSKSGGRASE